MSIRIIEVVDYRDEWPDQFSQEKAVIQSLFSNDNVEAIHHIGSTSVKGLCAKPIIDILMEVKNLEVLDDESHLMGALGYLAKGEFGITGRRYFQKGDIQRSHQIHAFLSGSVDAKRHLAFRDYLIAFPHIASEYASIKREGASICQNDVDIYCDHKNSFIKEHEAKALDWKFA
ncbi:dephospho-CoA kinase/protein folding accessory domain-containing protein [Marinomonas spartinae]|uniref:Dephospho-CoA kinase/protein folding accessory domain-containing protein n=1 Tax=Marinomonas spartinae TaxID=1792290 RepID=A0A1A8TMD4_9GAMM|nr:GrpB family protein [Marinomonas spartinae]SBS35160.1 dephospho-CoA kinase/protein folding accessory domain-containing protein [Marinomonas spartinae]SBS38360.1 dephospho-CoA kinase/protein folding accessory domain-containing protein [Marinomonas spartinae]